MLKPAAREFFHRASRFIRLLSTRFCAHNGLQNAASLTYTTLLSLVPLTTVVVAILTAFPVADQMAEMIQDFIFENFVPAAGAQVQQYLQEFSSKASRLTGIGFAALIIVALLMMRNIDQALNSIWEVPRRRTLAKQFLIYWALLSLGPLLLALSLAVTSYIISMPLIVEAEETLGLGRRLIRFAPLAASMLAFFLMYLVIPNRRVPLSHALSGGLLAAVLFELAKHAFAFYVTTFTSYQAIYGTLAVIPIFLVWVYLSWVIFLLGAEFTCSLQIFDSSQEAIADDGVQLKLALQLLAQLQHAHQRGEQVSADELIAAVKTGSAQQLQSLLTGLQRAGYILEVEDERLLLAMDLRHVTLYALFRDLEITLPVTGGSGNGMLNGRLRQAESALKESLGVSVEEVIVAEGYLSAPSQ
ncbi:MAG: virulence factor BrkB family protein [Pseudomonadota bacterium]|nr:virulence factor BrkB family protein [Pseudomonadota bacterium]